MSTIINRIKARFFNKSNPMEYRISIIFFIVTLLVSILSATTNTLLHKGIFGIAFQWTFIVLMIAFLFANNTLQLRLFKPLVFITAFIYIPLLYTQTAGYKGTALMFSLLCVFIISVAFEKTTRIVLIISNLFLLLGLCFLEFWRPDLIVPHANEQAQFVDQLVALAVTMVAMSIFSIYIINELKNGYQYTKKVLNELEEKNKNLVEISQIFVNLNQEDDSVRTSMSLAGSFLNCQTITLWGKKHGEEKLFARFIWSKDCWDSSQEKEMTFSAGTGIYDELFIEKKTFVIQDTQGCAELTIPLYIEGQFWGALEFVHVNPKEWSGSDIQLSILLTNVFTSFIERRKYEYSILEAKELAESASRAKSNFLSNMSHEIRTPMNAIIGMTKIGLSADSQEKVKDCLTNVQVSSVHLLGIINDILDISKIESGKIQLEHAPFHFKDMLDSVCDLCREEIEKKPLNFILELGENLKSGYIGDKVRVSQIITNLLSNGIKFTPPGGSIILSAEQVREDGEKAVIGISVKDTGIGISQEQLGRIFNSFEQADNSITRRFGGTGLGLSIAKNLVEQMDGKIWVESILREGTKFSFEIQLEVSPEEIFAGSELVDCTQDLDFSDKYILLAEDIDINQQIFVALLEDTGVQIDCVNDGKEALNAFLENPDKYDVIFMDIQMPNMDGFEATRAIRASGDPNAEKIPIIAMTANVFKEDIQQCLEAGMNDHLGKPIEMSQVNKKIQMYTK